MQGEPSNENSYHAVVSPYWEPSWDRPIPAFSDLIITTPPSSPSPSQNQDPFVTPPKRISGQKRRRESFSSSSSIHFPSSMQEEENEKKETPVLLTSFLKEKIDEDDENFDPPLILRRTKAMNLTRGSQGSRGEKKNADSIKIRHKEYKQGKRIKIGLNFIQNQDCMASETQFDNRIFYTCRLANTTVEDLMVLCPFGKQSLTRFRTPYSCVEGELLTPQLRRTCLDDLLLNFEMDELCFYQKAASPSQF
jgi:hypothetical protein